MPAAYVWGDKNSPANRQIELFACSNDGPCDFMSWDADRAGVVLGVLALRDAQVGAADPSRLNM
jgi:hypothetical protein